MSVPQTLLLRFYSSKYYGHKVSPRPWRPCDEQILAGATGTATGTFISTYNTPICL